MAPAVELYLGTSTWTAPSWAGGFYPPGTTPPEYLPYYSRRFRSVEIDSTWYGSPSPQVVSGWASKTDETFRFAAKVPRVITHEKLLRDCEDDLELFLEAIRRLGPRLGVLLLQFPYFKQSVFPGSDGFLERLAPFLDLLPPDIRIAVEVRNKGWLGPPLLDVLRSRNVALAWIDHPWMPLARQYARIPGSMTADFLYVRWLGDRHGIEEVTTSWNRLVVDRTPQIRRWVEVLRDLAPRARTIYGYFNNHYAGCAYQSAFQFEESWQAAVDGQES